MCIRDISKGADFALTPSDVFLALSAQIVKDGKAVANTNKTWADANPALPAQDILCLLYTSRCV